MESKTKVVAGGLTCILWSRPSNPEESVKSSTLEFETRVVARGLVTDVCRPSGYTSVYCKYGI
jgi:hypothetical protein